VTLLDIAILLVWLGLALCGFWKGAVRIVFGVGGVVAGVATALVVGDRLASEIAVHIANELVADVLGRAVPLLGCVVVFVLAGWGIERTLRSLRLNWANRLLGAVLTGVVGALAVALLLSIAADASPAWAAACSESALLPWVQRLLDWLRSAT